MSLTNFHSALIDPCVDKEKDQLKNHTEVILLVAHACLITQNFQCVGKNTEYELTKHKLPNNWNSGNGPYELRYEKNAMIYTLNGSLNGNQINISLKKDSSTTSLATTFKPNIVAATQGSLEQMVPKYKGICMRLIVNLIKKVEELQPSSSDAGSSSPASSSSDIDVVDNEPNLN